MTPSMFLVSSIYLRSMKIPNREFSHQPYKATSVVTSHGQLDHFTCICRSNMCGCGYICHMMQARTKQLNSAKLRPSVVPCKANLHMQRNSDGHQTRSNTSTSCKWPSCADSRTKTHTRTIVRFNCTSNKKSVDDNGVKYNHEGHVKGHHKEYRFYFF